MIDNSIEINQQQPEPIQSQQQFTQKNTAQNFYEQMDDSFIRDQIERELSYQESLENTTNYGSMIILLKNADNLPKYMLGPHCNIFNKKDFMFIPTLFLSSWFLIYSIQTFHQKLHFGTLSLVLCSLSALFFIVCYFFVGISNPGIASKNKLPTLQERLDSRYCRDCKVLRVNKTRHCQFCNVCIIQMDHHCIWVGKCIGKDNMKHFKLFIASTLTTLVVFSICIFFSSERKPLQIN